MIDWGNAPAWLSLVVTAVALAVASLGARTAYRQLMEVQSAADERRREEQRSHASKIAVWLERDSDNRFHAFVNNAGPLPVFNTYVTFVGPNIKDVCSLRTLPPTAVPKEVDVISQLVNRKVEESGMAIQESFAWDLDSEAFMSESAGQGKPSHAARKLAPVGLTITFTDAEINGGIGT